MEVWASQSEDCDVMAAHRIRVTNNNVLPRCKSEGTLIDLSEDVSEASLTEVKGQFKSSWDDNCWIII